MKHIDFTSLLRKAYKDSVVATTAVLIVLFSLLFSIYIR